MDWLQFISNVIASVAWPTAAAVIVIKFSPPISELIKKISTIKHKDTEVNFREIISETRKVAVDHSVTISLPPGRINSRLIEISEKSPRLAVMEGWIPIEQKLKHLMESRGIKFTSTHSAIRHLQRIGALQNGLDEILFGLMKSRNEASHSPDFSLEESDTLLFLMMSKSVLERLEQIDSSM